MGTGIIKVDNISNLAGTAQTDIDSLIIAPTNIRSLWERSLSAINLSLAPGSFEDGGTISSTSQALIYDAAGIAYKWGGTLPKVVAANSTPASSGGISSTGWIIADSNIITSLMSGYGLQHPSSLTPIAAKGFWRDINAGANIWGFRDRVFIGDACTNDGKLTNTTKDWLETLRASTTNNSQIAALSTIGQTAVLGGSRSSDSSIVDGMGCIGLQGWSYNNNTTAVQTTYAGYFESRRLAGAGNTHCIEFDIVNMGTVATVQPYAMFPAGLTPGLWAASGGEVSANAASCAMAIVNNGASFDKGIVFHATSVNGTDGVTGSGVAIELAKGHNIRQLFTGGNTGSYISFDVSNAAASQGLIFSDVGTLFRNSSAQTIFSIAMGSTNANGIQVVGGDAASTANVFLNALGSSTNIDLTLTPKGSGRINFADSVITTTATAGAATALPSVPVGYLSVKINGTFRLIPFYQ